MLSHNRLKVQLTVAYTNLDNFVNRRNKFKCILIRRLENPDAWAYYRLFSMTFKRQNIKSPLDSESFQEIPAAINSRGVGEMCIAETPTSDITYAEIVICDIWDNKMVYRWSAASNADFRHSGATSLLLFGIILDLKEKGYDKINLFGANMPELGRFLAGFNRRPIPYFSLERRTGLARMEGWASTLSASHTHFVSGKPQQERPCQVS